MMKTASGMQTANDRCRTSAAPEWLGKLAHDLRGPIGPIQLAARLLETSGLSEGQLPALGKSIGRQVDVLIQLANELDDLLSIGLGVFCIRPERCDFPMIVKNAVAHAEQSTASMGREWLPIAIRMPPASIPVDADETRLSQLIAQLLTAIPPFARRDAACWIECERVGDHAVFRVHDGECRIYRSDAVDYLISGNAPTDPGTLGMATVIGRQVAAAHAAIISSHEGTNGQIRELVLRMPLAGMQTDH